MPSPPRFACPELAGNRNSGWKTTQPSRFPGLSPLRAGLGDVACAEKGVQPDCVTRERVRPPLVAVDHAARAPAREAALPQSLHRRYRRPARGHDVLDEAHALARGERALDPTLGPVPLRVLAD